MALSYKYFRFPFAVTGDLAAIPDTVQIDGSVSYPQGFGPDYALDPATQPAALNIPRDKSNQLYNDVTTGMKYLQEGNVPQFIAAADNGGVAFVYGFLALVLFTDGYIYQSVAAANNTVPGASATWVRTRIRMGANMTLYVRSDGNDSNNGLVNSAGGAFLTLQKASDVLSGIYDLNNFQASVTIGTNATYAGVTFNPVIGQRAPIIVTGLSTAGTIINTQTTVLGGVSVSFSTMKFAGGANGIVSSGAATCLAGIEFGAVVGATSAHIYANGYGSISMNASYTISGGAGSHYQCFGGVVGVASNVTVTITGTPAFAAFLNFNNMGFVSFNQGSGPVTFTGAATGARYSGGNLSCVNTGGMGTSYLPGNAAGTLVGGAVYN